LTTASVLVLRLPSIRQEEGHDDGNSDHHQDRRAAPAAHGGVDKLTSSEERVSYLDVQLKFHRYSFGHVLLIALQCPDATRVAGWLDLG
jgi:hypothetical protein